MRATWTTLIAGLAGLLVTGTVGGCTAGNGETGGPSAATDTQSVAYEKVVRDALRSVVQITTTEGLGSGIVYDAKGDIVTNAHVVGRATTFQVTTATSQRPLAATLVASYPPSDLAVIRVSGELSVPAAKFADSGTAKVGQQVLAMGSPLGLSGSVTNGIVSAVGRTVQEPAGESSRGTTIPDMIQTSAAINPGNSGGALVTMASQVIGVPTLAATDQQDGGAAPGIGFAISSNTVTRIADQIIKSGKVLDSGRAVLGVTIRPVLDDNFQPAGAAVVSVTRDGPAAKAGIRSGDVITALDGTPVADPSALSTALAAHEPGDTVRLTISRNGANKTVRSTLGKG